MNTNSTGLRRWLFALLDAVLLAVLLLIPVLWLAGPIPLQWRWIRVPLQWGYKPLLLVLILLIVRGVIALAWRPGEERVRSLWSFPFVRRFMMLVFSVFISLFGAEFVLKVLDYDASTPPVVIKGQGDEWIGVDGLMRDDEMMWKFSPGGHFKGWQINSMGFREREIDPVKRPNHRRVISLGDSCTADGGPPYAGCLHDLLNHTPPTPHEWEAFNMGVYGYSSVQGLRVFQRQARPLQPDMVTIYFGWNDHWLCGYRPDSHRMAFVLGPGRALVYQVLRHKRFGQLIIQALTPGRSIVLKRRGGDIPSEVEDMLRVPHEEYRYTLMRMAAEIRGAGAIPVFITAPCRVLPVDILVSRKQARSREDVNRLHDEYVEITREVAAATQSPLLDLRAMLGDDSPEPLFQRDGIHLTQHGLWRVGEELYKLILDLYADEADSRRTEGGAGLEGKWTGWAAQDTNRYEVVVQVNALSAVGDVIGSFSNITQSCAGFYRWIDTLDGTYFMQVEERRGACMDEHTDDYLRRLPDGRLLYTSRTAHTETVGVLVRAE